MCKKLIYLVFTAVMLAPVSNASAGLVAHWTFDETSGTVAHDSSGSGLDGSLVGGPQWVPGQVAGALQFDGSNDYVRAPYIPFNNRSFTIAMWVNPVLYTDQQIVFSQRQTSATNTDMHFRLGGPNGTAPNPGAVRMGFYSNDLDTGGGIIQDNTWYHITFWYDFENQDRRIYVNGVQEAQQSGATPYLGASGDTVIGSWAGSGQWFRGIIDDVRVYDLVLSDAQVGDLFNGIPPAFTKAEAPDPPDGATGVTSPLLSWKPGDTAMWHDVYLGTNPTPPYKGRQPLAWAMWFQPGGWVANQTYYWRIDEVEVDGTTTHVGDVWSFTAAPLTAYDPDPPDGARNVSTDTDLSWTPGATAIKRDIYLGTDETEVTNGTGGTFIKGDHDTNLYDPGALAEDTRYFWRIDEKDSFGTVYAGDVWSFTTVGPYAGAIGFYYEWTSATVPPPREAAFANLVMTRIDPQINFNWDTGSPAGIRVDQFAARWIADIEAEFSEPYTIWTQTDDGIRVWLDGVLIIDNWTDHGATFNNSAAINFVAGQTYRLEMEWYENTGGARAELYWSSPSTPRQFIPSGPLQQPLKASSPNPANGATGVKDTPTLKWKAGEQAAQHQVFLGTDETAVANADTTTVGIYRGTQSVENSSYVPSEATLEWDTTYYWKVNEANGVDLWEGSVWNFTVADYFIVDDFEDYDDLCNRVFYTWLEGGGYNPNMECGILPYGGNGTGSLGGYATAPYAEQTIVHSGLQSMPMEYLNDGSYGNALYSEISRTFEFPQDFTRKGMKSLTLWFQGQPGSVGSFGYDPVTDVYTMTADGWDIEGTADGFHYAYKRLSGVGSIQAQVLSVQNTNTWAKAGVMIRETLDANSVQTMTVITPGQGVSFQRRPITGQATENTTLAGFQAPYWVRISRSGNIFTSEHSANGTTWEIIGTQDIPMASTVYVGLALTSHTTGATCTATFSDVTISGTVTGQWQSQDIGIASNDAERLYVALEDSTGRVQDVPHPDPNAVQLNTWQEWNIDLAEFAPVDLTRVTKIYVGVGDRDAPKLGGSGMLYIDDIRLYAPRCFPSLIRPAGDFSNNCVVDYPDIDIMTDNWLISDYDVTPEAASDVGLVANYRFENNLLDSSGNGNHADPCGAPSYVAGQAGNALEFDGIDDYVRAPHIPFDNRSFTIAMWVNPVLYTDQQVVFAQVETNSQNLSMHYRLWGDGRVRMGFYANDLDTVAGTVADNNWYHIAFWYDFENQTRRIYVDGLQAAQDNGDPYLGTSGDTRIGQWNNNQWFRGVIDDVRIYGRALSQAEVASLAGKTATFTQPLYLLLSPPDPAIDMNTDGTIDLKDYALLADIFLEEKLWP